MLAAKRFFFTDKLFPCLLFSCLYSVKISRLFNYLFLLMLIILPHSHSNHCYTFQTFKLTVTFEDVRNGKSVQKIPGLVLRLYSLVLVIAVCVLFLIKLLWLKTKRIYNLVSKLLRTQMYKCNLTSLPQQKKNKKFTLCCAFQVLFFNFQPIESTFQPLSRFQEIYIDTKALYQMSRLGSNHFKWRWSSILTNCSNCELRDLLIVGI